MKPITISLEEGRRLAIHRQLLGLAEGLPEGKEGVARTIETLGYVQIDTISVVARAHHHTLWARRSDYEPSMLHELLAADRRIFEYWGHAASYLPMSDYRYYVPRMRRAPSSKYGKSWLAENRDLVRRVHERIRKEGPLGSKDFQRPKGTGVGAWWDWKPAKMALELLFSQGKLMITERRNFQRVYDLTERVLPRGVDTPVPTDEDVHRFLVGRALDAFGLATEREIRLHIDGMGPGETHVAIDALLAEGEIVRVAVEGKGVPALYARPADLDALPERPDAAHCRLLCPFDNLIILRERIEWLFDFDYTLECYVPEAKRVHGYFVFPILYGDRLVGRLDPKADRRAGRLLIRSLALEASFDGHDEFFPPFAEALARFARFNGCSAVQFERIRPTGHKRALKSLVKRALEAVG